MLDDLREAGCAVRSAQRASIGYALRRLAGAATQLRLRERVACSAMLGVAIGLMTLGVLLMWALPRGVEFVVGLVPVFAGVAAMLRWEVVR